ncbi:MAG: glycolate oxidase subunit GlcF [Solirubrobacteraceae bacterium]|nr:glycolate oxidase subunit GlcF [Solirubrobacteraceae bacterium]
MRHEVPVDELGPRGPAMAQAIEACVHCGFCLATCPTYVTMGEEMDSPRGRILLMKETLEGTLEVDDVTPFVDACLGCQACETACPSGVEYGTLVTPFRAYAEPRRRRAPVERLRRELVLRTLPHPRRMRLAARAGRAARPLRRLVPRALRPMLDLLPPRLPDPQPLPPLMPAQGARRARVALLAGCAQQVLEPDITAATARVLARQGVEVAIPPGQGCCGSLAWHAGAADQARALAARNLDAFPDDVDAIVTNAAGCGSGMREYPLLFAGDPRAERAERVAARVVDVNAFLAELGLREPAGALERPTRVAYQDACHLAHAQGVRDAPRRLLEAVGDLELVEPEHWELCCGSAGTYNLERPEVAAQLGERKARALLDAGAQLVATANIGCLTQVQAHLRALGADVPVLHTMQLLDRAAARGA